MRWQPAGCLSLVPVPVSVWAESCMLIRNRYCNGIRMHPESWNALSASVWRRIRIAAISPPRNCGMTLQDCNGTAVYRSATSSTSIPGLHRETSETGYRACTRSRCFCSCCCLPPLSVRRRPGGCTRALPHNQNFHLREFLLFLAPIVSRASHRTATESRSLVTLMECLRSGSRHWQQASPCDSRQACNRQAVRDGLRRETRSSMYFCPLRIRHRDTGPAIFGRFRLKAALLESSSLTALIQTGPGTARSLYLNAVQTSGLPMLTGSDNGGLKIFHRRTFCWRHGILRYHLMAVSSRFFKMSPRRRGEIFG